MLSEAGNDGTFLETRFQIPDDAFVFKLKNDNEGDKIRLWRYQHFYSNSPLLQTSNADSMPTKGPCDGEWSRNPVRKRASEGSRVP